MAAVQYFGRTDILAAYNARGLAVWGMCRGKELMTVGEDATSLDSFLRSLEAGGSAAEYTLRFYKDDVGEEIERDTPYHSSYCVKLTDAPAYSSGGVSRVGGNMDPITAELHGYLAKKVSAAVKRELEGGDEQDEETIGDLLKGLLKNPEKLIGVIGAVKGLFSGGSVGLPVSLGGTAIPTQRVGGTVQSATPAPPTADELVRLQAALDKLGRHDKKVIEHLEKLANLAEKEPEIYSIAINKLNGI